jgi:RHH-type proline utilization regulon transcriptional repressor/proline dehydrogenase/delta 1-pyrroline-5-carboxylate dehydrogenase
MDAARPQRIEALTREVGARLHREAVRSRPAFFGARGVRGALLRRALADERLRTALFQFIDVLPQLEDARDRRALPRLSARPRAREHLGQAAQARRSPGRGVGGAGERGAHGAALFGGGERRSGALSAR